MVVPKRGLERAWLMLSIAALFAGNCLALLLILSRMPPFALTELNQTAFRTLLVLHVDLSIYVWLLSAACLVWSLVRPGRVAWVEWLAWGCCAAGTLWLPTAALSGPAPVINNYLPVLDSPAFLAGIGLFMAGVLIRLVGGLLARPAAGIGPSLNAAVVCGMWAVLAAVVVVGLAGLRLPAEGAASRLWYESLFWGGGHLIQFAHLFLMVAAWLWLAGNAVPALQQRAFARLLWLALLPALAGVLMPLLYPPLSPEYRAGFTGLMRYCSWLVVPVAILGLVDARRRGGAAAGAIDRFVGHGVALFLVGMAVGAAIRGDSLRVPAHYHAMTGAVNLALMGLVYRLLPRFGGETPAVGACTWQARLYSGGLLMLVGGLAWAGWLGISRKVAGLDQGLTSPADYAAMGLMGLGGLVSLAGSFLFLWLVVRGLRGARARVRAPRAEVAS